MCSKSIKINVFYKGIYFFVKKPLSIFYHLAYLLVIILSLCIVNEYLWLIACFIICVLCFHKDFNNFFCFLVASHNYCEKNLRCKIILHVCKNIHYISKYKALKLIVFTDIFILKLNIFY